MVAIKHTNSLKKTAQIDVKINKRVKTKVKEKRMRENIIQEKKKFLLQSVRNGLNGTRY